MGSLVLLAFTPLALALEFLAPGQHNLIFLVSVLAIIPLAGYIGVQDNHCEKGYIEYRTIAIKELNAAVASSNAPNWRLGTQAYTFNHFTLFDFCQLAGSLCLLACITDGDVLARPEDTDASGKRDPRSRDTDNLKKRLPGI